VSNVSVASGAWKNYTITVPSGAKSVLINMTGSGDGDLYVKKTGYATTTSYDFRPYLNGSAESVTISTTTSPALSTGTWYVSVNGYTASTVNLTATASF